MAFRFGRMCVAALVWAGASTHAVAQGYRGYPDIIMNPPPRVAPYDPLPTSHKQAATDKKRMARSHRPTPPGRDKFVRKLHQRSLYAMRGSSGSVLPTPLPKTRLIPPEGGGALTLSPMQQDQGPTQIPGTSQIVPNLPHGTETFQDRASRCTFQAGLYGVPGSLRNQYMGACVQ